MFKYFTYKGFSRISDAMKYARVALAHGASYVEIIKDAKRFGYENSKYVVQHNCHDWIKEV